MKICLFSNSDPSTPRYSSPAIPIVKQVQSHVSNAHVRSSNCCNGDDDSSQLPSSIPSMNLSQMKETRNEMCRNNTEKQVHEKTSYFPSQSRPPSLQDETRTTLPQQGLASVLSRDHKRKTAAIYIDLDNFPIRTDAHADYSSVLEEIETKYQFKIISKKIFGDLIQFSKLPSELQYSHQLINCPKVNSRKNTTDIALAIDIIRDLERKKPYDVFIIASSDSDYVPIVRAIIEEDKECWLLPSHTTPHEILTGLCTGVLQCSSNMLKKSNSSNCVSPTCEESEPLSSSPSKNTKTLSPKMSPRKESKNDVTSNQNTLTPEASATREKQENLIAALSQLLKPAKNSDVEVVKNMITNVVKKLYFAGASSFNLSYVHERLRERGIFYKSLGYSSFKSLFDDWKQEHPQFKLVTDPKNGELIFSNPISVLKKVDSLSNVADATNNNPSRKIITNQNVSVKSFTKKEVKKAITEIVNDLKVNVSRFNLSIVHERLRERGILYKAYGYESFKEMFAEWAEENHSIPLGIKKSSGEMVFL